MRTKLSITHVVALNLILLLHAFPSDALEDIDYFADLEPGKRDYVRIVTYAHTDKIMGSIRKGRMDNALADCRYTLDRIPNHPKGLALVGMLARLTKNPSLAISYYRRALKLYPQYAITRAQYGGFLVDSGNAKAGIAELQKALEMDPTLTLGHKFLIQAYRKTGNPELARQAASRAKEVQLRRRGLKQGLTGQSDSSTLR